MSTIPVKSVGIESTQTMTASGRRSATLFQEGPKRTHIQNTSSGTFMVQHVDPERLSCVCNRFHEAPTGDIKCLKDEHLARGDKAEYTAYCMTNVPTVIVDIWVGDDLLVAVEDNAEVPKFCHPGNRTQYLTMQLTFQIDCEPHGVPTAAPGDERRCPDTAEANISSIDRGEQA